MKTHSSNSTAFRGSSPNFNDFCNEILTRSWLERDCKMTRNITDPWLSILTIQVERFGNPLGLSKYTMDQIFWDSGGSMWMIKGLYNSSGIIGTIETKYHNNMTAATQLFVPNCWKDDQHLLAMLSQITRVSLINPAWVESDSHRGMYPVITVCYSALWWSPLYNVSAEQGLCCSLMVVWLISKAAAKAPVLSFWGFTVAPSQ